MRSVYLCGVALSAFLLLPAEAGGGAPDAFGTQTAGPSSPLQDESISAFRASVQAILDEVRADAGVEGVSVAVVTPENVLFAGGSGVADARGAPAGAHTVYRIGSLTKAFTAMAFLKLVEQGHATLDAPIQDYVPEFSVRYLDGSDYKITARDLITHHAGLPGNMLSRMWSEDPESAAETIDRANGLYAVPPGTVHAYSNLGTVVLGQAIENISGRTYSDYVLEEILRPLGMNQTGFVVSQAMQPNLAEGFFDHKVLEEPALSPLAAGALYSSVADLAPFMQMILSGGSIPAGHDVLNRVSIEQMFRPQNEDVDLDLGLKIGLPWYLDAIPFPGRIAHHTGGTLTFKSVLVLLPDQGLGVVVLTNAGEGEAITGAIAHRVLDLALQSEFGRVTAVPEHPPLPDLETTECGALYTNGISGPLAVSTEDGSAHLRWKTGEVALESNSPGILEAPEGRPVTVGDFEADRIVCATVAGRSVIVSERGTRRNLIGERIEAYNIPDEWRARLGDYEVLNPDPAALYTNFSLREENGLLLFDFDMPYFGDHDGPAVVRPISEEALLILGLGRATGDVIEVRHTQDGEILHYSGYLLRRRVSAASRVGLDVPMNEAVLPEGVWRSRGYGLVLDQALGAPVRAYQFDPVAGCQLIPSDQFRSEFEVAEGGGTASIRLRRSGAPGSIAFDRVSELPAACRLDATETASPLTVFDNFCAAFRTHYAFFRERRIDWNEACEKERAAISKASDDAALEAAIVRMIRKLNDRHVRLVAGRRVHISGLGPFLEPVFDEFNRSDETSYRPMLDAAIAPYRQAAFASIAGAPATGAGGKVAWGWVRPGVAYLWIGGFTGFGSDPGAGAQAQLAEFRTALNQAMKDLQGAQSVVVDLRLAHGGMDVAALELAGRFSDRPWLGMAKQAWTGDSFTPPQWIYVTPRGDQQFTGPVALLVSNFTVSAAENFAMMMINRPQSALIVGEQTAGVHSDVLPWRLPNGWLVTISNELFQAGDGSVYETTGLTPDIAVAYFEPGTLAAPDRALTAAIEALSSNAR